MKSKDLHQSIRQVCFVGLIIAVAALILYQLNYFVGAALGAFTLYMLLRKMHRGMVRRGWNRTLATLALILGAVLIVVVLGGAIGYMLYTRVINFQPKEMLDSLDSIHELIVRKTGYDIFSKDLAQKAVTTATRMLPGIFTATTAVLINLFLTFLILFFMLQADCQLDRQINKILPLRRDSILLIRHETNSMVISNAIGIPLVMLSQAVTAGLGYWMLGAGDPVVWGLLSGIAGLVPVVGSSVIWLPLSVNLILSGSVWQGVVLVLYGALIVANVDNLLRMLLMKRYANVHPLVTLFGIILGLKLFGFWGIIFGPLLISGFMLLFKIYRNEFLDDNLSAD